MPTYIYKCDETGEEFEYLQSINSEPLKFWPKEVEGYDPNKPKKVHRKIGTGIGVVLKGTGFYETDYVRKAKSSESSD